MREWLLPRFVPCLLIAVCCLFTNVMAQDTDCANYDEYAPLPVPLAGGLTTPSAALGVNYYGDFALVACGDAGLLIYNIFDPASPQHVSTLDTPGTAYDVIVDEDLVCVADGEAGVHVVDISNLTAPAITFTIDTPGLARALALTRTD